ncbi:VENN motif pre-toxin domain-containing protein [Cronobacter dublinensis]
MVKAQGGNAAAGAAGGFVAASGSAALSLAFYNKKPEELSPDEKTVIVNLVAALGAAGGSMAAGNSTGIGSGANAARVEVENNYLSGKEPEMFAKKLADCGDNGSCRADVMKELAETSNKNIEGFSDCLKAGTKRASVTS